MADAYIGLGSNLGDKRGNLLGAIDKLREAVTFEHVSSLYATEPVGFKQQDWFLNAVAKIQCGQSPRDLLTALLSVEEALGRVRTTRNAPRTIDLDVLLYGDLVLSQDGLVIPHPRMAERAFVLTPLAEIAPDLVHPLLRQTMRELKEQIPAPEEVRLLETDWFEA